MSVLIKGMEMPKHGCDHCFLRTGNYCGRIEKDESMVEYAIRNERHPDCPLVSVPPHGDLIDKNALRSKYKHELSRTYLDDFAKGWQTALKAVLNDSTCIVLTEDGEQ